MDLGFSESSSRILSEYRYKADHYNKLYPKRIYPYSKPVPYSISLHGVPFYGDPKYKNKQFNLLKKSLLK